MLTTEESAASTSPAVASLDRPQILPDAVYLTDEAAAICRVRPSTIRQAVRNGRISGRGRPFRIRGRELFKLL